MGTAGDRRAHHAMIPPGILDGILLAEAEEVVEEGAGIRLLILPEMEAAVVVKRRK